MNGTARSSRARRTSSTDSFDGRVAGHAAEEAELVGAEAERREHGRVELSHRPLPERLDRVVERSHPLHRAERELSRERPVAVVEPLRCGAERPVGVGVLLEDAADDLVRREPGRRNRHGRRATTWNKCQCLSPSSAVGPSASTSSRRSTTKPSSRRSTSLTRVEVHVGDRSPLVPLAEELAAEATAGAQRAPDRSPGALELVGWTERQREARVHEVRLRQVDLTMPRDDVLERRARVCPPEEQLDRSGLRVDREHAPAPAQKLECVAPGAAAEVDSPPGRAALGLVELERPQKRVAGGVAGRCEVPDPRVAIPAAHRSPRSQSS